MADDLTCAALPAHVHEEAAQAVQRKSCGGRAECSLSSYDAIYILSPGCQPYLPAVPFIVQVH